MHSMENITDLDPFSLILVMLSMVSIDHHSTFQSKKKGKDQESIQSSTTSDPGYQWKSDNFTIKHAKHMQVVYVVL